ncbi:aspartic peptidase domain-containing protein [Leptodontidium sp. 2 PMI_412]|nr:aspartic peptidase domain-containing protein [Leptodontidium sp. 2 PMI_412]
MAVLSIVLLFVHSLVFFVSDALAAKVISYSVSRALPGNGYPLPRSISERSNTLELLSNNKSRGAYYATVEVGTPAQKLSLLLSTGSSDIWIISNSALSCKDRNCVTTSGGFDINYYDGSYARGDYIKDLFAVGENGEARMVLQIGLANNISDATGNYGGIMGIDYSSQVAASEPYPNLVDQMVDSGLTNTRLYSIWLNSINSDSGSILFGGIDTEKYYGTLYSMPIHKDISGNYTTFTVGPTSLSTTLADSSTIPITNSSFSTGVLLDSSTTAIYLPKDIVKIIYDQFEVTFVNDVCSLGILEGASEFEYFLGDFFLRSAYMVFDLTNNRIGIVQSNQNSTTTNIVEVPSGAVSIPQSTGVLFPSGTSPSTPAGPTISASSSTTDKPKSDNHALAIGTGVAVPVVVVLAALFGFCLWWRRRRRSSQPAPPQAAPSIGIPELTDSSNKHTQISRNYYGVGGEGGGLSPTSNASELHSTSNIAESPGDMRASFTPTMPETSELPVYSDDRHNRPMSSNINDYYGGQRPVVNLMTGPQYELPARQ